MRSDGPWILQSARVLACDHATAACLLRAARERLADCAISGLAGRTHSRRVSVVTSGFVSRMCRRLLCCAAESKVRLDRQAALRAERSVSTVVAENGSRDNMTLGA